VRSAAVIEIGRALIVAVTWVVVVAERWSVPSAIVAVTVHVPEGAVTETSPVLSTVQAVDEATENVTVPSAAPTDGVASTSSVSPYCRVYLVVAKLSVLDNLLRMVSVPVA
jgi:hypothetical protein